MQRAVICAKPSGERRQVENAMMSTRHTRRADAIAEGDALAERAVGRGHAGSIG